MLCSETLHVSTAQMKAEDVVALLGRSAGLNMCIVGGAARSSVDGEIRSGMLKQVRGSQTLS